MRNNIFEYWKRTWLMIGWVALAVVIPADGVVGQDGISLPWVNENGEPIPVGLGERERAATNDRESVPVRTAVPFTTPNLPRYDFSFLVRPLLITMFVIGIACIIGLMIWMFVTMRIGDRGGSTEETFRKRTIEESVKQLPFELSENFGDFRAQALAAYQAGDLRKSLILLFSHVLVTLDQRNLVHLKKGKTNRQYLRELKPYPGLAGYYGDVMVPFEQTFFGDHTVDKSVCEKCWDELDRFQSDVASIKSIGVDSL